MNAKTVGQSIRPSGTPQNLSGAPSGAFDLGSMHSTLSGITNANNAHSAKEASQLRDWQVAQTKTAMDFNSKESAKNRDFQKMMSDTAYQRQVKDMVSAGLNPVLSALGGGGAATTSGSSASSSAPSGAMGQTDNSMTAGLVSFMGSMLNQMTQLETARVSAQSNQAIADKYNAMSKYTADLNSQTTLTTSNIHAMASMYASDNSADATRAAASISAAANRYGHDVNSMTQKEINAFNATVNKELAEMGYKHDFDIKTAFPSNLYQAAGSLSEGFFGGSSGKGLESFTSGMNDLNSKFQSGLGSVLEWATGWKPSVRQRYSDIFKK